PPRKKASKKSPGGADDNKRKTPMKTAECSGNIAGRTSMMKTAAVAAELTPLSLQMMSPVQSGGFIAGLS
ncbi:hypothetical protein, partial [Bradyrhizobium sp. 147]|uniref:hypothetical protein n=1 Tax=Bradyrhizobium sp. 147 TaxID=2782623 RepID=UPI001FF74084